MTHAPRNVWRIPLAAIAAALSIAPAAAAAEQKLSFAVPGVPPVFGSVVVFVAKEEGFFKKHGVDVDVRPFDSGAAAAQAVVAGNPDMSLSPTPVIVRMISNAGVNLVGIYGLENPDWLLASTDPAINKCADVSGQAVGVDSVGGARSVALEQLIRPCGLKIDQVKLVALSTNVGAAMVAGQLKVGVLHLDDVPVLEEQLKKPLTMISSFKEVNQLSHYLILVAKEDNLKQKRDAFVRAVAGLIDATKFMQDPKNADRVAKIATVTGRTEKLAKDTLPRFEKISFWPVGNDGLSRKKLEAVVATEKDIGGIKPGKTPVAYDRLVDPSVWKDASALAK
ncbi:MAG TPA: ABC transporter substrate-binding protein [Myxococcales bacterium]|nr:ABC transporter substrate-binding protein [Myxococcales bacterium]